MQEYSAISLFMIMFVDFEPLDTKLRDNLLKEQERYLKNMKKLANLRKEAPEKVKNLSSSLADAATLLFENSTIAENPSLDVETKEFQEPYAEIWSNEVNLRLIENQKGLVNLSQVCWLYVILETTSLCFSHRKGKEHH